MTEISEEKIPDEKRVPTIRTIPFPGDANPSGDVFGGWLLAKMDMAGGAAAYDFVGGRVVTRAIDAMAFHRAVYIGDFISIYTRVGRVGRTSIAIKIECWARRRHSGETLKVTEGTFTFVAIDNDGNPKEIGQKNNDTQDA